MFASETNSSNNQGLAQDQSSENSNQSQPSSAASTSDTDLASCQQELASFKDKYLRMTADFENFKRRTEKEKVTWIRTAQANVLFDVLEIVDDFDRALDQAHKQEINTDLNVWLKGFELTRKALQKLLQKYEVQEIVDHELFNPEYHEAVQQVESPEHISGAIVSVLQKGYTFKGQVLRPAKVSVAQ